MAAEDVQPHKPTVKLIGTDGHVYSIMAKVCKALKRDGQLERAEEFRARVDNECHNYDDVLELLLDYVDPE